MKTRVWLVSKLDMRNDEMPVAKELLCTTGADLRLALRVICDRCQYAAIVYSLGESVDVHKVLFSLYDWQVDERIMKAVYCDIITAVEYEISRIEEVEEVLQL